MSYDFKKEQKELYRPKTEPSVINVPEMVFLMVDGSGDPNVSQEYIDAVQALYGLSYAIRMNKTWAGYFEYVVAPLEGLWRVDDPNFRGKGALITDKSKLIWTSLIRQPDFVTPEIFEQAKEIARKKKPEGDFSKVRLEKFNEGLCIQVMHIGPYDTEADTIVKIGRYAKDNGYTENFKDGNGHHEIYLGDPRKSAPEKLKTIIRHPVRKG